MSQRNKQLSLKTSTARASKSSLSSCAAAKVQSSYGDHHRFFLQSFLSRGICNASEVKKLFSLCHERFQVETSGAIAQDLYNFVRVINDQIRSLHMEIKKGISEEDGVHFYALVNTTETPISRFMSIYSQSELELFKKVVEKIVESESGTMSSVEYLNLSDILDKKMSKKEAQELLERLVEDKWLHEVNGRISLSTRSIIELDQYIREMYPQIITLCNMCHHLVLQGQSCINCDVKMHNHCAQRCYDDRQNPKCPECQAPWPHQIDSGLRKSQSEMSREKQTRTRR